MQKSSKNSTVYHVSPDQEGLTLAAALKAQDEAFSWGQVKRWISRRHVQVNGNLCLDEARRISGSDVIKVWQEPLPKPVDIEDIRIRHLDDHLVVLCKPAGVTSVRHFAERKLSTRRRQLQPTVEELLPPAIAKILKLRWPPLPPKGMNRGRRNTNRQRRKNEKIQNAKKLPSELQIFPVHRLDRDTSGLMLFARTKACEQLLIQMFRRHQVEREYVAFCQGEIEPQTIQSFLARDRGDGIRGTISAEKVEEVNAAGGPQVLDAITHVVSSQSVESSVGPTLSKLRCKLETGRTHQIRIHLAEAGHPICGDKIYHQLLDREIPDESGAPRQALHSDRLTFRHPITSEQLEFHMPLPNDLVRWIKRLNENGNGEDNEQ